MANSYDNALVVVFTGSQGSPDNAWAQRVLEGLARQRSDEANKGLTPVDCDIMVACQSVLASQEVRPELRALGSGRGPAHLRVRWREARITSTHSVGRTARTRQRMPRV